MAAARLVAEANAVSSISLPPRRARWHFARACQPSLIISLLATIANRSHALLVAVYAATCLVVTRMNRGIAAAKIQARETSPDLVARDRQAELNFGRRYRGGDVPGPGTEAYATLGWGWPAPTGVVGTILSALASLVLFDTWFYWFHRLIHTRWLYRPVHQWHHTMTVTPVVWSNNSDRLVDNLFLQSCWLVALLIFPSRAGRPPRAQASTIRSPGRSGIRGGSMPGG